jgi:hypothetical protein
VAGQGHPSGDRLRGGPRGRQPVGFGADRAGPAREDGSRNGHDSRQQAQSLLGNIKIQRVGHPGTAVALDDSPTCPDDWNSYNLTVNWTYDTDTGVTLSSQAIWNDALTCDNMSYMESATSFFFDQQITANGNTATCGSQGSPDNNCGYSGIVSTGNWSCDAGASCAGDYEMSGGVWVELPAGWQWDGTAPPGCWDDATETTMICSFNTNPITVPAIN